jgi:hypothetical protein
MSRERQQTDVLRTVLWQGIWRPGAEWCQLGQTEDGWRIGGTALVAVDDEPHQVRYDLALDRSWATRDVELAVRTGDGQERRLRLAADERREWKISRRPGDEVRSADNDLAAVRGLSDIDLGFSPSTNTLPIRRFAPAIGEAVDVTAVWVRFPELTIEPLPQRYTRLDEHRYRYESNDGAFVAGLEVDDLGLVVSYEGGWARIAVGGQTASNC